MAKSIYNAFVVYKRAFDKNKSVAATQPPVATTGKATATSTGKPTNPDPKGETVYKIQLLATKTKIKTDSRQLKGYKDVEIWEDRGYYKYMYGKSTNLQTIKALQKKVQKDFKDAFIVPLKEEQSTKQKKL
jgi:N-acetylmuramoyl-L-alanine amidase